MSNTIDRLRDKIRPIPEGSYLLGLSGGADSVFLLMSLLQDIRDGRISLEAVHVNHGIRGAEADEDERFCNDLCLREGIPFLSFHADLRGKTDEASARKARFGLYRESFRKENADALLLAHNADDQAETFLMRLLRGAGPEGLSCMKEDEITAEIRVIRPILSLRRQEIRDALLTEGICWREDSTNQDPGYLRNRIRMELIPEMERFSPYAVSRICAAAAMIAEDHQTLEDQARILLEKVSQGSMLDAAALTQEPVSLRKRVIRLWWKKNSPAMKEHALSADQTAAIVALLDEKKGKINLPGDMHAIRAGRFLFLRGAGIKAHEPVPLTSPETVFDQFCLMLSASQGEPGDGKVTQEIPEAFLEGCVIRTRLPGDRITPFGSSGSRKLQDYLTDRKIPEPFRDQIPMICRGNEVLMICGIGTGHVPRWKEETHPVRLTWCGNIPWME